MLIEQEEKEQTKETRIIILNDDLDLKMSIPKKIIIIKGLAPQGKIIRKGE